MQIPTLIWSYMMNIENHIHKYFYVLLTIGPAE